FFAAMATIILYRALRSIRHFSLSSSARRLADPATLTSTPLDPGLQIAGVTAILFATCPAVVALARVAEMYTLSACLAAAILYCLLLEDRHGTSYAALLLGLGLSVHPTLIFLLPLFLVSHERSFTRRTGLFFLL